MEKDDITLRDVITHFDLKFGLIDQRFDKMDQRFDAMEKRVDLRFDKVDKQLDKFEDAFQRSLTKRVEQGERIDKVEHDVVLLKNHVGFAP